MSEELNDPQRWSIDLFNSGWVPLGHNVWKAPDGALFRGPYAAWCALNGEYAASRILPSQRQEPTCKA